jgi:hypothetical protein
MPKRPTRLPLAPLAEALGVEFHNPGTFGGDENQTRGVPELAARLSCSVETVYRMRNNGLTPLQADRYAMSAGIHPARIWPNWWNGIDDTNTEHAELACVCDHDLDHCTCGYYGDDPPMGASDVDLAA